MLSFPVTVFIFSFFQALEYLFKFIIQSRMMLIRYLTNSALYSVDLNFKEVKPVLRDTCAKWANGVVFDKHFVLCFKVSATLQDRPRADRCSFSCFYKNPYKPYIF